MNFFLAYSSTPYSFANVEKIHKRNCSGSFIGTTQDEGFVRARLYSHTGCNVYDGKTIKSQPMGFWTKQDVLRYVIENDLEICSVYGDIKQSPCGKYYLTGEQRTGCMFCAFGGHLEPEPNRFQRMSVTHPGYCRLCFKPLENGGLGMGVPLDYLGIHYETWESVGQMNLADFLNEERSNLCGK